MKERLFFTLDTSASAVSVLAGLVIAAVLPFVLGAYLTDGEVDRKVVRLLGTASAVVLVRVAAFVCFGR